MYQYDFEHWWLLWWDQDYSWEGLAKKWWQGWIRFEDGSVLPNPGNNQDQLDNKGHYPGRHRLANLQDYWRQFVSEDELLKFRFTHPDSGEEQVRTFSPIHFPTFDKNNRLISNDHKWFRRREELIAQALGASMASQYWVSNRGPMMCFDGRAQLQGISAGHFNAKHFLKNKSEDGGREENPISVYAKHSHWSQIDFSDRTLSDDTEINCSWIRSANFRSTTFAGRVNFNNSYLSYPDFRHAKFEKPVTFKYCFFDGENEFTKAEFLSDAWFQRSIFCGRALFSSSILLGEANFSDCLFYATADFSGISSPTQQGYSSDSFLDEFTGVWNGELVLDTTSSERNRSIRSIFFDNSIFFWQFRFDDRDVLGFASFKKVVFLGVPSFLNSRLHEGVNFFGAQFSYALEPESVPPEVVNKVYEFEIKAHSDRYSKEFDKNHFLQRVAAWTYDRPSPTTDELTREERSEYYFKLEDAFRTLKHLMENLRNRNQEAEFFKLELAARRKRTDTQIERWEHQVADVYRVFSDSGTSFALPVVWLFFSSMMFAVIYLLLGSINFSVFDWVRSDVFSDLFDALSFSAKSAFGFGVWSEQFHSDSLMFDLIDTRSRFYSSPTNFVIRLLSTTQSIISIVLIFLAGLAVRRKFQIN